MIKTLAQSIKIGGETVTGPLEKGTNWTIGEIINRVLLVVIPLAGIILFLILVWGGYDFMLSGGNAEKVKKGRAKITAALVGFFLLVTSYLAARIISQIFGIGQDIF